MTVESARRPRLTHMYIYPTLGCNADCIFCSVAPHRYPATSFRSTLTPSDVRSAIQDAVELGLKELAISGGEPLLRWDLVKVAMEEAFRHGVRVAMETNLTPMDGKMLEEMVDLVRGHGGRLLVAASLHSADPQLHDRLMALRGAHRRAVENLRALAEASRRVEGLRLEGLITVTRLNLEDVPRTVEFLLEEVGVHAVKVTPVQEVGNMKENRGYMLGLDDLFALGRTVEALSARYGGRVVVTSLPPALALKHLNFTACPYDQLASILPDGSVSLCRDLALEGRRRGVEMIAGNVKERRLRDIFLDAELFRRLREMRARGQFEGACGQCAFRRICAPACPAYAFGTYGRLTAPNPTCQALWDAGRFPLTKVKIYCNT